MIVALLRYYFRGRKRKLALQATTNDPCSPRESFIQFPPRLVGRSGEGSNHRSTPSPSVSSNTGRHKHLNMDWTAVVTPKQSRDFGTETSSLGMPNIAQSEAGNTLLETNSVTESLDRRNRPDTSNSIYSMDSLSHSQISDLRTQPGQLSQTFPSLAIPVSPNVTQTEVYPTPEKEHIRSPQQHVMKVADVETTSLGSASSVTQSRLSPFGLRPGLPSSPASFLARSPLTSVVVSCPHTTASFLDSPPKRNPCPDPCDRPHLRSRSYSSTLARDVERVRSPKGTPDLMISPRHASAPYAVESASDLMLSQSYASVPYAVEKASGSSRSQTRSLTRVSAIPKAKDHVSMETYNRKSDKGCRSALSSRTRPRARSHNWAETGKEAPKWI